MNIASIVAVSELKNLVSSPQAQDILIGNGVKAKVLPIASAPTGSEQDTGWDLPDNSLVLDVLLWVDTVETTGATKTFEVGILASESGGDADGFIDAISVATTAGWKFPSAADGAVTLGAFLREDITGTTKYGRKPYRGDGTAKSISFTSAVAFTEFRGAIVILYLTAHT